MDNLLDYLILLLYSAGMIGAGYWGSAGQGAQRTILWPGAGSGIRCTSGP